MPIISNPPVDPLQLNTSPIPAPAITPPNNVERSMSFVTACIGIAYNAIENVRTDTIVYPINCFPSLIYPKIRMGKFNKKFTNPVLKGVKNPIIIAIPLIPLLNTLWGIRKRLKESAAMKEPKTTPSNRYIFFPPFTKNE